MLRNWVYNFYKETSVPDLKINMSSASSEIEIKSSTTKLSLALHVEAKSYSAIEPANVANLDSTFNALFAAYFIALKGGFIHYLPPLHQVAMHILQINIQDPVPSAQRYSTPSMPYFWSTIARVDHQMSHSELKSSLSLAR